MTQEGHTRKMFTQYENQSCCKSQDLHLSEFKCVVTEDGTGVLRVVVLLEAAPEAPVEYDCQWGEKDDRRDKDGIDARLRATVQHVTGLG